MAKVRIDQLLVDRGFCSNKKDAQAYLMAGYVLVMDHPVTKVGILVDSNISIRIKHSTLPFVSRGGIKLQYALHIFNVNVNNKNCIDIGASTGGFTDCLLQNGASFIYAVDVGENQLHWSLRRDRRVFVLDHINVRYWNVDLIPKKCEILVADLSFISLKLAILPLIPSLAIGANVILLIKPQFEAKRNEVSVGGIVNNILVHNRIKDELWLFFKKTVLTPIAICYSPIKGLKGNQEFFLYLRHNG